MWIGSSSFPSCDMCANGHGAHPFPHGKAGNSWQMSFTRMLMMTNFVVKLPIAHEEINPKRKIRHY